MSPNSTIADHFEASAAGILENLHLEPQIDAAAKLMYQCFENGGKLLICGNGGSAADAQHLSSELLNRYQIETSGKKAVVIGRSNIVGRPMSILLSRSLNPGNCTVTLCHSRTQDLSSITQEADILIAALGKPGFVTADMVKQDAVVIDVGITRVDDSTKKNGYRLQGDVKFDEVAPKCSYITPVPGGVGPLTVCSLLQNTLKAYTHEIYPES